MTDKHFRWLGLYLLPALLSISLLAACSDDDDELTPLATPTSLSVTNAAATSLSFSWGSVANAAEYYCVLYKDGTYTSEQRVTDPAVTFTALTPSTTYTLQVIAYAAIGCNCNVESSPIELEGRTADPVQLATPVMEVTVLAQNVTVAWEAVANADSYDYSLTGGGTTVEADNTTDTTLAFTGLAAGDYVLTVTAKADDVAYSDSEAATETISIVNIRAEEWRTEGTYLCGFDNTTWKATVVKYNDGTYEILNFYQGGRDMEFAPADGYANLVTNWPDSERDDYFFMATGLSDTEKYCLSFPKGYEEYNLFEGGGEDSGELSYWYYSASSYTWCQDYFAWGTAETELFGSGEEEQREFTGTMLYNVDWDDDDNLITDGATSKTVTLVKNDDGSYSLKGAYDGIVDEITFNYDSEAETIEITNHRYASSFYKYYYYYPNPDDTSDYTYLIICDTDYAYAEITDDAITIYWYVYDYTGLSEGGYHYFTWTRE